MPNSSRLWDAAVNKIHKNLISWNLHTNGRRRQDTKEVKPKQRRGVEGRGKRHKFKQGDEQRPHWVMLE